MFLVPPDHRKIGRLFFISLLACLIDAKAATQAQPKLEPKGASDQAAEVKTLLKERQKLHEKIVRYVTENYRAGVADFAKLAEAQRNWLRATLELEEDPGARIALLKNIETSAKEAAEIAEKKFGVGHATALEPLQAKVVVLDVQIELLREKAKVKPPN
jgi:outer membrane protein TolC